MKPASTLIRAGSLLALGGLLGGLLGGCNSQTKAPAPVRPVLTMVVAPAGEHAVSHSGTIQPRYQTELGFRVLGRIVSRNVGVGDLVKPGQILAQLDPLILDLAVRSSEADLAKSQSQLSNATAAETRGATLFDRKVTTQADFDALKQAREAAAASVQQAQANLAKAREQRGYATLSSDLDGVVTTTDAEVGQTVAPGQRVMTLARTDARDAVVDLPEDVTRSLAAGASFAIELQADPSIKTTGKVREIAPQSDAVTRTRRIKITLDEFTPAFRLGATISATPRALSVGPAAVDPLIELPGSALLDRDGKTFVWVVDPAAKTVRTVPVEIAQRDAHGARISGGLETGARVVVAGVHSLAEGQAVKIDEGAAR